MCMKYLLGLVVIAVVHGCATYGGATEEAVAAVRAENYAQAETEFAKVLPAQGKNALLHYLELGMIKHLDGQYEASNDLLEQAYQLADYLYADGTWQNVAVALSNPTVSTYHGAEYERAAINIIKALNYLSLAETTSAGSERLQHLDDAAIEIRRLNILLRRLETELGDYQQASDESETPAARIAQVLRTLTGNWNDPAALRYRSDAWGYYLSGLAYEMAGQWDDARIAFDDALRTYQDGAVKQYDLDPAMIDLSRQASASAESRAEHKTVSDRGDVVVVQLVDLMPRKGEMNLYVHLQEYGQLMEIQPVLLGSAENQRDQAAWFLMQYGDLGFTDILGRYLSGGIIQVVDDFAFAKKVPLFPIWDLVQQTELDKALAGGIRVAVPYYPSLEMTHNSRTRITLAGNPDFDKPMLLASSPARVALQQLLLDANRELRAAIGRELLKAILSYQVSNQFSEENDTLGFLTAAAGKVASTVSARADTRAWLTLPKEIRMQRLSLPPGHHELTLITHWDDGGVEQTQSLSVDVEAGTTQVVSIATINPHPEQEIAY